jgi:hypothetical protein
MLGGLPGVCRDPEEIAREQQYRAELDPELAGFLQWAAADTVPEYFSRPSP